jgi:hypothetical protein
MPKSLLVTQTHARHVLFLQKYFGFFSRPPNHDRRRIPANVSRLMNRRQRPRFQPDRKE